MRERPSLPGAEPARNDAQRARGRGREALVSAGEVVARRGAHVLPKQMLTGARCVGADLRVDLGAHLGLERGELRVARLCTELAGSVEEALLPLLLACRCSAGRG